MVDDELVAGAPVMYPGRVPGSRVAHLGRAQARAGGAVVLEPICPAGRAAGLELERIPLDDADDVAWCGPCNKYRGYLINLEGSFAAVRKIIETALADERDGS